MSQNADEGKFCTLGINVEIKADHAVNVFGEGCGLTESKAVAIVHDEDEVNIELRCCASLSQRDQREHCNMTSVNGEREQNTM